MRTETAPEQTAGTSRKAWWLQLGVGALCLIAAGGLFRYAGERFLPAPEFVAALPGQSPPVPLEANRTPHPDAPPREIGPTYDGDAALPEHAKEVASYWLKAKLDADTHRVTGSGRIKWTNTSDVAVRQLWLHLYLNAFKNADTVFLRSPFGAGRSGDKAEEWGYIDLVKLRAVDFGGVDLLKNTAKHSPDDPKDETDIRVDLPQEVAAGATLTLEVEWESQLPRIVERTGYLSDYHFVAQWFPKLARLERDGTWRHFTFHAQSEFYADYGNYDVTLDVPERYVVGASGETIERRVEGGRLIQRQRVQDVHDFAWTAWPGFQQHDETIDGVAVKVLYPPAHERNLADTLDALRFALPHFGKHYGRYPYKTLTVVHPPRYAANSGGMEYPTLITTGGAWHDSYWNRGVGGVTIHELGHQWFYGLVGTDEHNWPFLDEGLNSYAELVAMREHYGESSLVALPSLSINRRSVMRAAAASYGEDDVVGRPAAAFPNFRAMGALVYARTATIMDTLAGVYGRANVERALGRYMRYYRFKHPGPRHFVAAMREVLGDEASQNLERALFERGRVDYTIRSVESQKTRKSAGIFDDGGRHTVSSGDPPEHDYTGRALVYRHGDLKFPVQVLLVAQDGSRSVQDWDGRSAWVEIQYHGSSPLAYAVVDPESRIGLDTNPLNNAARNASTPASRSRERLTYAAQLLLGVTAP